MLFYFLLTQVMFYTVIYIQRFYYSRLEMTIVLSHFSTPQQWMSFLCLFSTSHSIQRHLFSSLISNQCFVSFLCISSLLFLFLISVSVFCLLSAKKLLCFLSYQKAPVFQSFISEIEHFCLLVFLKSYVTLVLWSYDRYNRI